jgi:acyl carrier protein
VSSPAEIRDQLADVLHEIAGVAAADVRDTASLKDLGVDSLAAVELAEGLERTFHITPPDVDVAEWRTVGDVVRTVTRQQTANELAGLIPSPPELVDPDQNMAFRQLALFLAVIGALIGIGFGVMFAATLASIGLPGGSMPEAKPQHFPSTAGGNTDYGTTTVRRTTAAPTKASLAATPSTVAPGQRFTLKGTLPEAKAGEKLQIQMRTRGGAWEDFPVTVPAGAGGTFSVRIYTSTAGSYEFHLITPSGKATPGVTVAIGT